MSVPTLNDLAVDGATVGVRVDVNSPLSPSGAIADDARLRAHLETLDELLSRGGRVAVLAHQGRPAGEEFAGLAPHAERFGELLDHPVSHTDALWSADARRAVDDLGDGEAVVLENTRFYSEEYVEFEPERAAETALVERLAPHFDAYVNDAFAAAHRSQPSLVGFPVVLPAYAGRVVERELAELGDVAGTPTPRAYVLGGAKVDDAVDVARYALENGLADRVLTAGLVGNVFLLADGVDLGDASATVIGDRGFADAVGRAADLLADHGDRISLPVDLALDRDGERVEVPVSDLPPDPDAPAKDVGERTVAAYADVLEDAGTAVLNGPAGVFEEAAFATGTRDLFAAVTRAGHSIVGGGDTAAAIRQLGIEGFDHVSTGGGAALRLLSDGTLPAVEVLRR